MRTSADIDLVKRLSGYRLGGQRVFHGGRIGRTLAGWKLHLAVLDTWGLAPVKMVANTAACLVLLGRFLVLAEKTVRPADGNWAFAKAAKFTAEARRQWSAWWGCSAWSEHVPGWDFGIDQLLAAAHRGDAGVGPGLMSSITAPEFSVLGLGAAVIGLEDAARGLARSVSFVGAVLAAVFGLFALVLQPKASAHYDGFAERCDLLCSGVRAGGFACKLGYRRAFDRPACGSEIIAESNSLRVAGPRVSSAGHIRRLCLRRHISPGLKQAYWR